MLNSVPKRNSLWMFHISTREPSKVFVKGAQHLIRYRADASQLKVKDGGNLTIIFIKQDILEIYKFTVFDQYI